MHLAVIDPALQTAELDCYNNLVQLSTTKTSYHLPALFGMSSLKRVESQVSSIILLGSKSSVYDNLPWQNQLTDWLRPFLEKGVPTLGLCFGHQLLAHMYGGKVEYLSADKKKQQGFRKTSIKGSRVWESGSGELYGSHCEYVTTLPKGFRLVATTEFSPFEGLEHEMLPIFSLQSHPEAVPGFLGNSAEARRYEYGHSLIKQFLRSSEK